MGRRVKESKIFFDKTNILSKDVTETAKVNTTYSNYYFNSL